MESKMSLAGKKAWETRKKNSQYWINYGRKSEVKVGQVKAGGIKKKRIGVVLSNGLRYVVRDSKKSLVKSRHEEVWEMLYGRDWIEQILMRKKIDEFWREGWKSHGVQIERSG